MPYYEENGYHWENAEQALDSAKRVFITTHVNPDGDAIGSEMALARFLMKRGATVRIINQSKTPDTFRFLDPDRIIESHECTGDTVFHDMPGENDLVVFLDLGVIDRAGSVAPFLMDHGAKTLMIDHHLSEDPPVDYAVVTSHADSTGSLVFDLLCHMDESLIDRDIAEAVLTAIVTDTGFFTYSNTAARTHAIAAALYGYGVHARDLKRRLESAYPLNRQRLLGLCMAGAEVSDCGRIGYATITADMFEKTGTAREHTEGIINQVRIIAGISVALLIIQEDTETWKVSFRSMSGIPVNDIAESLGGGGHTKAAGATLQGSRDTITRRVLDTVTRALDSEE